MNMSKPCFGFLYIAVLSLLGCNSVNKTVEIRDSKERPNVLIIYPDQLRRYSAGFWSEPGYRDAVVGKPDPVITPTIDNLAKNAVVFTQAFANYPLCSPSRGMLLSGMYPEQNGIWNNARVGREESLKENIITITNLFHEEGYDISYFGKAHYIKPVPKFNNAGDYVGTEDAWGGNYINEFDTYIPPGIDRHDIDYYYQVLKDEHANPFVFSNDPAVVGGNKDGELYQPREFSTKIESETIIEYLKKKRNQRNADKPFFMIWSINPPHNPWDNANTDMLEYRKHYDTDKYPNIDSALVVRPNADLKVAGYARNYFANVTSIDKYIGRVLEQLKKMKVLDNTIVVFTADHGEMMGSHGLTAKNVFYTESTAVPFIVHWPKKVKPGKTDALLGSPDIYPTIASLAGLKEETPEAVEGKDLSAFIKNPGKVDAKPGSILLMLKNSRGLQTNRYTLVLTEVKEQQGNLEGAKIGEAYIFDNKKDPYQYNKIPLEEKPGLSGKLLKVLAQKLKKANDPWFQDKKYKNLIPYQD
ncbi:sulfatase-like hydrolase/transferase [Salegentibacter sp. BLCTC]|uniref:sulfatase family protein n=1 Tax=Salegentibacter sp. BLCTC TaxID=2697368 RepID=UPI00187B4E08|nr:sulfatase [Salegentibacter sp. BLCTC]MBE7640562.1 sulfatase-like hydrolase/transferase [Salegentibacter sp. BLCTC]